jgi:hypothetical protein
VAIPVHHQHRHHKGTPPATGSTTTTSPGGTSDPYAAAAARETTYRNRTALHYAQDAETLKKQAAALRIALGKKGFQAALQVNLANVAHDLRQAQKLTRTGYRSAADIIGDQSQENVSEASQQTIANLSNAGRERANAISEAMNNGAGETDTLLAQGMSLRNWSANQADVNSAFQTTKASIEGALDDLNTSTRTNLANNVVNANADRKALWQNYYDRRSETLTQLGNVLGQIASDYATANEYNPGKDYKESQKTYGDRSGNAFERASKVAGQAWDSPGVPKRIMNWEGRKLNDEGLSSQDFGRQGLALQRPEGATLRSWGG